MKFKEWWDSKSYPLKFMYGLWIGLIIGFLVFGIGQYNPKESGLRINQSYIKAIEPCKAELNDFYVSKMIEFADECEGGQKFFRFVSPKGQLYGISLWCPNTSTAFTFYYSDKWRQENNGKK